MPLFGTRGAASVTGFGGLAKLGYLLRNSLRFRASNNNYLNRTQGTSTNQSIGTWSFWFKRGTLGTAQRFFEGYTASSDTGNGAIEFGADNCLYVGGWSTNWRITTQVFRDPSAWYHMVVTIDTTQATANNRIRVYVNGTEITAFSTTNNPTQNSTFGLNNNSSVLQIGRRHNNLGNDQFFDGYLAEINFVDGQALTPSSFGKTDPATGQWIPIKYSGTYGTNGFYLPFTNTTSTSTLGNDFSGNSNTWTVNNISLTAGSTYDSMTDVPTLTSATAANYCTLNPLSTVGGTFSNGNLEYAGPSSWRSTNGTLAIPTSGQWYFEATLLNDPYSPRGSTSSYSWIGVGLATNFNVQLGPASNQVNGFLWGDNSYINNFSSSSVDSTVALSSGDVMRLGIDTTNNTYTLYRNASLVASSTFNVTAGTQLIPYHFSYSNDNGKMAVNFGQRPFAYPTTSGAFSGYKALNAFNLP